MTIVNEGSSALLTLSFKDEQKTPQSPDSLEYRIDDLATRAEIRDWTSVSPAAGVSIALTPAVNQFVSAHRKFETHKITIRAQYAGSETLHDSFAYRLKRMGFS